VSAFGVISNDSVHRCAIDASVLRMIAQVLLRVAM
jgi:hypothetical protein